MEGFFSVLDPVRALLLVVFDNLGWTHFRPVRVLPKLSQCMALAQQIPALIEFDL